MDRFQKLTEQGIINVWEIWVDTFTGVQYLWHTNGSAGGLTPLLDAQGKPVITPEKAERSDEA